MAGQGEFQAPAQCRTMQGSDHGFAEGFDAQQQVVEERCSRRRLEFTQIGAGDETSAGAVDYHALHPRISLRGLHRREQGRPDGLRQRIDRRILDLEDRDVAVYCVPYRSGHGAAVLG